MFLLSITEKSVYIPINLIIMNFVFDAYINFTINSFIITCLQVLAYTQSTYFQFVLSSCVLHIPFKTMMVNSMIIFIVNLSNSRQRHL